MKEILLTLIIFAVAMFGLSLGTIFRGKKLKEPCCGGGACAKREAAVCPGSHNDNAKLVQLATSAAPHPSVREHRAHH